MGDLQNIEWGHKGAKRTLAGLSYKSKLKIELTPKSRKFNNFHLFDP